MELIDVVNPHNPLSHCGVYWLSSLNHPYVVVISSSEWLVRSWWYAHHIYMRIWFPRQTCILTDSCFWPKCCGSNSWDSLPYAVNSQCTTLYQCLTEEDWLACARNFHRTACWKRLGIMLQKLTPLKTLLGKDSVTYARSFCGCLLKKAEYLVREIIHVSYWRRYTNLALEASWVSCEGRLGYLHQKLLIVICGPISTYITILIFLLLISCMKRGFAGLSSFPSTCHIFACFQVHRVPKSSSMKN